MDVIARWLPPERRAWLARHLAAPVLLLAGLLTFASTLTGLAAATPPRAAPTATPNLAATFIAEYHLSPPQIAASSAYVYDASTGVVLYQRHPDDERAMASTTKIMTALVAVQHASLSQTITAGADAAALVNPDNSYMGLSQGEQLTLNELLYGLLLPSGNDAAVAIADGVGGGQAQFVALMNQEAGQLGLAHTHFANPHGLDATGHYTTARDLARLATLALGNPVIAQIAATRHEIIAQTATHKAYDLWNYNSILPGGRAAYPGAIGLKPGNTGDAGWCEAFAARRYGHLVIGVVLNDPTWSIRNTDMHALLDWGFVQLGVPPAG
ncbi:MAG TPA: D-alanyl-D-alanine carboxypeptidase family protein [Ktedonobacterales bacterium]